MTTEVEIERERMLRSGSSNGISKGTPLFRTLSHTGVGDTYLLLVESTQYIVKFN